MNDDQSKKRDDRRLKNGLFAAAILLPFWLLFFGPTRDVDDGRDLWPREEILRAIFLVESGGLLNPPDGDKGKAIGPYQIHKVYWIDAVEFDKSIGGTYQDCRRKDYAEQVIHAYMRRHARDAWDRGEAEVIARIHNGGPDGHRQSVTDGYWVKVRSNLSKAPDSDTAKATGAGKSED